MNLTQKHVLLVCGLIVGLQMSAGVASSITAAETAPTERLVYCPVNLLVDKNVEDLIALMKRCATAGYTGVMLNDSKFGRLAEMEPRYFNNINRVKTAASEAHLEVIPAVFPLGYSESLLSSDPNLAEGLPLREVGFVVTNGMARLDPAEQPTLKGGTPLHLEQWDWHDPSVSNDGTSGVRMTANPGQNVRLVQKISVRPFHQYHFAVWIKSVAWKGTAEIKALAGNFSLNYAALGVATDQDWTLHHAVFNSLDKKEIALYLGSWDAEAGSLWWKDAILEDAGLLNVVRRDGAPLTVTDATGVTLTEGRDYQPVADPRMGCIPWKGAYEIWHESPPIRCARADGTHLRVSAYHAITTLDGQVMICPSEPKTLALLIDQAQRMHAAWGAKGYFMSHDEIRVLGWDDSCTRRKITPGAILADNLSACTKILKKLNPGGRIYVWSDMFDPNHNAHDQYYLVNGDLAGSWNGLDPSVIVAAWYFEKRDTSLKFFANRGNPLLIAGYYDSDPAKIRDWLTSARAAGGAEGIMYTTWQNRYVDLERFLQEAREAPKP